MIKPTEAASKILKSSYTPYASRWRLWAAVEDFAAGQPFDSATLGFTRDEVEIFFELIEAQGVD